MFISSLQEEEINRDTTCTQRFHMIPQLVITGGQSPLRSLSYIYLLWSFVRTRLLQQTFIQAHECYCSFPSCCYDVTAVCCNLWNYQFSPLLLFLSVSHSVFIILSLRRQRVRQSSACTPPHTPRGGWLLLAARHMHVLVGSTCWFDRPVS